MADLFIKTIKNCPQCGYQIEDPKAVRCPRCYKALLTPACCGGSCSNCGGKQKAVPGECADCRKTGC